jgi:hypothetical protein
MNQIKSNPLQSTVRFKRIDAAMMIITNLEITGSRVYSYLTASCYEQCISKRMQSAKTADFRHRKQTERTTHPWLSSLMNEIQSKVLPARFEQIDAAIVITIDRSPLIIELFHEQIVFPNAFHVRLRLV